MGSNIKTKISPNIIDNLEITEESLNVYIHLNSTTQYILRCCIHKSQTQQKNDKLP